MHPSIHLKILHMHLHLLGLAIHLIAAHMDIARNNHLKYVTFNTGGNIILVAVVVLGVGFRVNLDVVAEVVHLIVIPVNLNMKSFLVCSFAEGVGGF